LGWLLFFVRHITALSQPKKIGNIFIQIQVFAELWVSWAELNLFFIFPMWGGGTPAEAIGTISPTEPSPGDR
jgi:hypothetical protein